MRATRNNVRDSRPSFASHSSALAVRLRCDLSSGGAASSLAKPAAITMPPSLAARRPARRTEARLDSPQIGSKRDVERVRAGVARTARTKGLSDGSGDYR